MATSKILVIDDSRVIRKTVRDMLPEGDFEVIEAKDGLEGINFVEKEHPSLIMLDFILPKMSGWDVFQQIQAHPDFQKIPLVLMSGKKEEVTSKISEPFEFFEFIEKPFDRVILKDAIQSAMTKARKARPRLTSELPQPVALVAGEYPATNDELDRLQAQIDRAQEQLATFQSATSTQIHELQAQLVATDRAHAAEIQDLMARFEATRQDRDPEQYQATVQKVIHLETEVDTLKKQLGQLIVLIKKKLT